MRKHWRLITLLVVAGLLVLFQGTPFVQSLGHLASALLGLVGAIFGLLGRSIAALFANV